MLTWTNLQSATILDSRCRRWLDIEEFRALYAHLWEAVRLVFAGRVKLVDLELQCEDDYFCQSWSLLALYWLLRSGGSLDRVIEHVEHLKAGESKAAAHSSPLVAEHEILIRLVLGLPQIPAYLPHAEGDTTGRGLSTAWVQRAVKAWLTEIASARGQCRRTSNGSMRGVPLVSSEKSAKSMFVTFF